MTDGRASTDVSNTRIGWTTPSTLACDAKIAKDFNLNASLKPIDSNCMSSDSESMKSFRATEIIRLIWNNQNAYLRSQMCDSSRKSPINAEIHVRIVTRIERLLVAEPPAPGH